MDIDNEELISNITTVLKDHIRLERKYHRQESESMSGVEASRIVAATLESIAKNHNIDLAMLREEHRPIVVALNREMASKVYAAEDSGYDRGRIKTETRHYYLSGGSFGLIVREDEAFDRARIFCIIDAVVRLGGKSPGTMDGKKIDAVQTEMQSCQSTGDVTTLLDENRALICEAFGIDDDSFTTCLKDIHPSYEVAGHKPPFLKLV